VHPILVTILFANNDESVRTRRVPARVDIASVLFVSD
jgi:hypothetical protein